MVEHPIRIPAQPPDSWSDTTRALLGGVVPVGSVRKPVHLPAVVAHHPTFLGPYLGWAKAVALEGVLSARHAELLALRTALRCDSPFEWGVHTQYAAGRGCLDDGEIGAVAAGPDHPRWDDVERALLRAADELHDTSTVAGPTWQVLAGAFGADALVEVVFVVGHCTMLSMVANAAGVPPAEGWPPLPDAGA